ncbi:uncharacterized protein LOC119672971 [Teleopsis dalmanni]|uniref:uncharacterized protein LOC119672971 n=1 Tax=Teleopsis dalmanni TaxID=139649 RepID=UPI0018CE0E71|nr:uncharacterized protein LOC119672971 [Teleopsis dalmanni]
MDEDNIVYTRTIVPSTMRSPFWKYFGFPSDNSNNILTRKKIICTLCNAAIAYNKNTSNLRTHLIAKHPEKLQQELQIRIRAKKTDMQLDKEHLDENGRHSFLGNDSETHVVVACEDDSSIDESAGVDYILEDETILNNQLSTPSVEANDIIYMDTNEKKCLQFSNMDNVHLHEFHVSVLNENDSVNTGKMEIVEPFILTEVKSLASKNDDTSGLDRIVNMLVTDLLPIDVIRGQGIKQLIADIEDIDNNLIMNRLCESYDKMFAVISSHIQKISQKTTYSLSFEYMENVEKLNILSIYFNYYNKDSSELSNILYYCVEASNFASIHLFNDLELNNCAAIITNSWTSDVTSFVAKYDIPAFKCLYAELTECLTKIFNISIISSAFSNLYKVIQKHYLKDDLKNIPELFYPCPWSKLNFLLYFFEEIDLCNAPYETELLNEMSTFAEFLKPLKLILNALVEEPFPFCTMMRPFIMKLFKDHFLTYNIKNQYLIEAHNILSTDVSKRILDNKFLSEAMFLDGRFQQDFINSGINDRGVVKERIFNRFKSFIESTNDNVPDTSTVDVECNKRKSGLKSFFHSTFNGTNSTGSLNNRSIMRKSSIEIEFDKYRCEPVLDLGCCPLNWWQENCLSYKKLSYIAQYYLSVPCCASRIYHYDDNERWLWQNKRYMLRNYNRAEQCLWYLYYNKADYDKLSK